ncbi:hypothetical protein CEW83_05360 [Parazoarcus communis]|uniref:Uncharacterized protein n=1 Tax=Parazoarcus communis TaxID=41977 RepID=A0A2U8GM74_9RHOO|nr:hypothetical protein CEW83_05360 [Parazoarcus communis]
MRDIEATVYLFHLQSRLIQRSGNRRTKGLGVSLRGAVESAIASGAAAETRRRMSEGAQRPSLRRRRRSAAGNGKPKAANVCPAR